MQVTDFSGDSSGKNGRDPFLPVTPHCFWLNYASSFNVIEHRLVLLFLNDMRESARCTSRLRSGHLRV
jgi:hypothetical protein